MGTVFFTIGAAMAMKQQSYGKIIFLCRTCFPMALLWADWLGLLLALV